MKNVKLFPKTFVHCLILIVCVIATSFLLIYALLPKGYKAYKQNEIDSEIKKLAVELEDAPEQEISYIISKSVLQKNYGYSAVYESGEIICLAGMEIGYQFEGSGYTDEAVGISVSVDREIVQSHATFRTDEAKTVNLTLDASLQPIGDAVSALLLILPVVLVLCVALAVFFAYFYAKSITKPIKTITETTVEMQLLDRGICCSTDRNDELGVLSNNINEMYQKLLLAISELEQEIQTVSRAEQEKLDFLLLASHELKTPVTAVRGMIDGMIYHVGVYNDRDTYLKECQKTLEDLSELLCRIIETSRIDAYTAAKDSEEIDMGALLNKTLSPYWIIAQSRHINLTFLEENGFKATVSEELISKALSNIISNAVKYTETGRIIKVYMENRSVIVENECQPLSEDMISHIGEPFYHPVKEKNQTGDSTGLGLYFTDRILNACGLSYSFAPYEGGMRFVLDFYHAIRM